VLFYDKDSESLDTAFKENDIGIDPAEKASIVQSLKNDPNSKLIMQLHSPFSYEVVL